MPIDAQPRIEAFSEKKMIGKRMRMSLSANRTPELWRSFMPRRSEIKNGIGSELYSIAVYDRDHFERFDPSRDFEKWAAIEAAGFDVVPSEMETITLPDGLYAVFVYKGAASAAAPAFQYIFGTWLPSSGYALDDRPHFEVMGEKYKHDDPASEEEFWIPVKKK